MRIRKLIGGAGRPRLLIVLAVLLCAQIHGQTTEDSGKKVDPSDARVATAVDPKPQDKIPKPQDKIKVVFDDAHPGVVYVESNGERVRVDVNKKLVEPAPANVVAAGGEPTVTPPADAHASTPKVEDSPYVFG